MAVARASASAANLGRLAEACAIEPELRRARRELERARGRPGRGFELTESEVELLATLPLTAAPRRVVDGLVRDVRASAASEAARDARLQPRFEALRQRLYAAGGK